jgi:hypothetical protein
MEATFSEKFPPRRPEWLRDTDGNGRLLELDGFCEKLGLAFEFQGPQHFKVLRWLGGTQAKLDDQQRRDKVKVDRCVRAGVKLLVVAWEVRLPEASLRVALAKWCEDNSVVPTNDPLSVAVVVDHGSDPFAPMKAAFAINGKWRLLDDRPFTWGGARTKYACWCKIHLCAFYLSAVDAKQGVGCMECGLESNAAAHRRWIIEDVYEWCREKGNIACDAEAYVSSKAPMPWRCLVCGHAWHATWSSVRAHVTSCRRCADKAKGKASRKWSPDDVRSMRDLVRDGASRKEVARRYGIPVTKVTSVVHGYGWFAEVT